MPAQTGNIQRLLFRKLVQLQNDKSEEKGYALVVTIAMGVVLVILLATASILSKVDSSSTRAATRSNNGFFAAEAGLNIRAKDIRNRFEGFNRPSGTSPSSWQTCADGSDLGSDDFACQNTTFQGQNVLTFVDEAPGNPFSITIPTDETFGGLSAQEYRYDTIAVAQDISGLGSVSTTSGGLTTTQQLPTAILGMTFKSRVVSLFQFAIFYDNDADFSIPPNMTINGRVHSNNDLYLNSADATVSLRINGQVSTAGQIYRGNKSDEGTQQCAGNVLIEDESGTPLSLDCNGNAITPYLKTTTSPSNISDWGSQIKFLSDPLTVPEPSVLDPSPGSLYWDSADLRVVLRVDTANNPIAIEIRNPDNSVNVAATNALRDSCPVPSTTLLAGPYNVDSTTLSVASTANFSTGDAIVVGTDFDSNVIDIANDATPGSLAASTTINLKRKLGHGYQSVPIATPGNTVRKAVVSTSNTFFNYREKHTEFPNPVLTYNIRGFSGQYIRMLDVDVRALLDCVQNQDLMYGLDDPNDTTLTLRKLDDDSDGGLVWFFTVLGPDSNIDRSTGSAANQANPVGSRYGVRLYNGRYLHSTLTGAPEIEGLTIVSDQAIYLQGDFNLKDLAGTAANEGDNPATGVTERWRPAAILTDSLNVLSNQWKLHDANGITYVNNLPSRETWLGFAGYGLARRTIPTETTVNAAFLSGTEITGGGNGATTQLSTDSGGVNNYPRFHEDWDGVVPFNYRGSLVTIGQPRRINSAFCGSRNEINCNIYSPPIRNWDYDQDFNNAANLPPLTPRAVYLRQELFRREYDRAALPLQRRRWQLSQTVVASLSPRFRF